jgi:hypothetical protein
VYNHSIGLQEAEDVIRRFDGGESRLTATRLVDANAIRSLAVFPFRDRHGLGQVLLVAVLVVGLQVAFFPLAFVLDAGYSMQVARAVLCEGGEPALPADLPWRLILLDGARRCGIWLVFTLPGIGAGGAVLLAAGSAAWWTGLGAEQARWIFWLLAVGLSGSLLLCMVGSALANAASLHALRGNSFGAAFRVRAWWPVFRARFGAFEAAELGSFVGGLVLTGVGVLAALPAMLVCIGPPLLFSFAAVFLRLVFTAASALIYRDGLAALTSTPVAPKD